MPSKEDKVKSFHDLIGPVILLGNIFSIFPVSGIFSKNGQNLKFSFFNPITIYSIIVQLCFLIELILLFYFLSKTKIVFFMVGECSNKLIARQRFLPCFNRRRIRSNNLHTHLHFWWNLFLLSSNKVAPYRIDMDGSRANFSRSTLLTKDERKLLVKNPASCCADYCFVTVGSLYLLHFCGRKS